MPLSYFTLAPLFFPLGALPGQIVTSEDYDLLVSRLLEAEAGAENQAEESAAADACFVAGLQMRMCPKCRVRIEKNEGCDQMVCYRCGESFRWAQARQLLPNGDAFDAAPASGGAIGAVPAPEGAFGLQRAHDGGFGAAQAPEGAFGAQRAYGGGFGAQPAEGGYFSVSPAPGGGLVVRPASGVGFSVTPAPGGGFVVSPTALEGGGFGQASLGAFGALRAAAGDGEGTDESASGTLLQPYEGMVRNFAETIEHEQKKGSTTAL